MRALGDNYTIASAMGCSINQESDGDAVRRAAAATGGYMKRKVTVIHRSEEKTEAEVELPLFRKLVLDNSVIYTRINVDLSALHIDDGGNRMEIELDARYCRDGFTADYLTGRELSSMSSQEEFEAALSRLRAFTDSGGIAMIDHDLARTATLEAVAKELLETVIDLIERAEADREHKKRIGQPREAAFSSHTVSAARRVVKRAEKVLKDAS